MFCFASDSESPLCFYFITTVMWKHKASYSYEENQDSVADARFTSWFTVEAVICAFSYVFVDE